MIPLGSHFAPLLFVQRREVIVGKMEFLIPARDACPNKEKEEGERKDSVYAAQ